MHLVIISLWYTGLPIGVVTINDDTQTRGNRNGGWWSRWRYRWMSYELFPVLGTPWRLDPPLCPWLSELYTHQDHRTFWKIRIPSENKNVLINGMSSTIVINIHVLWNIIKIIYVALFLVCLEYSFQILLHPY